MAEMQLSLDQGHVSKDIRRRHVLACSRRFRASFPCVASGMMQVLNLARCKRPSDHAEQTC
jgi:hypothetical protein